MYELQPVLKFKLVFCAHRLFGPSSPLPKLNQGKDEGTNKQTKEADQKTLQMGHYGKQLQTSYFTCDEAHDVQLLSVAEAHAGKHSSPHQLRGLSSLLLFQILSTNCVVWNGNVH